MRWLMEIVNPEGRGGDGEGKRGLVVVRRCGGDGGGGGRGMRFQISVVREQLDEE